MRRILSLLAACALLGTLVSTATAKKPMPPGCKGPVKCKVIDLRVPSMKKGAHASGVVYNAQTGWVPPNVWGRVPGVVNKFSLYSWDTHTHTAMISDNCAGGQPCGSLGAFTGGGPGWFVIYGPPLSTHPRQWGWIFNSSGVNKTYWVKGETW